MVKQPQPLRNAPSLETVDEYIDQQERELGEAFHNLTSQLNEIHQSLREDLVSIRHRLHSAHVLAAELNTTFLSAATRIAKSLQTPAQEDTPQQ